MSVIELEHVHKTYGRRRALHDLSLRVRPGEVYGLLGPPGAGKTTLLHLLMGFISCSEGSVRVFGESVAAARARIGYLPSPPAYHTHVTAREYLRFLGRLDDIPRATLHARVEEELARAGLRDVANRRLSTFTTEMLQQFGVAQALLSDPDLLLLDEPAVLLDPVARHDLMTILVQCRTQGLTMLLTTSDPSIIEGLCDRVGVLIDGHLAAESAMQTLRGPGAGLNIQVERISEALREQLGVLSPDVQCGERIISLRPNTSELQHAVLQTLLKENVAVLAMETTERPLEVFYARAIQRMHAPPAAPPAHAPAPVAPAPAAALKLPAGDTDPLLRDLLERNTEESGS